MNEILCPNSCGTEDLVFRQDEKMWLKFCSFPGKYQEELILYCIEIVHSNSAIYVIFYNPSFCNR